ncbi:glyoxal reductase [Vallitalea longa]|uniref:Glyoxal reductase n=1 Tax=Vallitalea longa TaxID=2936439 RepID=A0A9W5Y8F9_9FIRM|nr:glyoxal reductase [Vallitalea longa]
MLKLNLNNGVTIPQLGFGTFRAEIEEAYNSVKCALENGYRHIDTAAAYGNEQGVGRAIKDSGIDRSEIFVTSKLWNDDQGYEGTKKAFYDSMEKLQLDYIDLYLIHWPKSYEKTRASWRAMEELYEEGKICAIGVSNFNIHHLDDLIKNAKILPAVNQVECHVGLQNRVLQEYCNKFGIYLEAYAPLMSNRISELLSNEDMIEIAKKYKKTVPQVAIRFLLQKNIIPLPKSSTPARIVSNRDVFDFSLAEEDMKTISGLNNGIKIFPEPDNIDF